MKIKIIHILSNILFAKLQNYFLQPWWKIANIANVTLKTNVALLNILLKIFFVCVYALAESSSTILNRKVWISFLASYFIGNTEEVVY